jgi:hypothetical protein
MKTVQVHIDNITWFLKHKLYEEEILAIKQDGKYVYVTYQLKEL